MKWLFAAMSAGLSIFMFRMAWEELGDRQMWLTPAYIILGLGCIAMMAFVVVAF